MKPSGRVVEYRASPPQVQGSNSGLGKVDSAFYHSTSSSDNGPRSTEHQSSDEDDTRADTLLNNRPHRLNKRTLSLNGFNLQQLFYTVGLQLHQDSIKVVMSTRE
ncbi:hypothetical protein TNCV_142881 [Trichonephila clavipes]|nr:hypothetical protein TNCV_142881 [Trichonephila clavipes]